MEGQGQIWSVTGRLLEGPYPNYRQVIPGPAQFTTTVTLSDAALEAVTRLLPRLPGKQLANRPIGLHCEKGRFGLLARAENDEPWILHPVDRCEMKGPDVTIYLDRDYLIKAADFGLHRISMSDAMSPIQFSRGGDLMIVMPVRAITPDCIERPRLVPAVEQFASPPVPLPKPVVPAPAMPPKSPTMVGMAVETTVTSIDDIKRPSIKAMVMITMRVRVICFFLACQEPKSAEPKR